MTGLLLPATVALCLSFSFTNGMKDGCNVFATAVSSGSISFRQALFLVVLAEVAGPLLFGVPVALTVARGIIRVDVLPKGAGSLVLIASGILGAVLWNTITWLLRLPTSSSFALVGGLIGPVLYRYGASGIPWNVFLPRVVGALFLSPILGIGLGTLLYALTEWLLQDATWKANRTLKRLHIASLIVLGMSHGTNDSQKAMGLIALLLLLAGKAAALEVPLWAVLVSVTCLAGGVMLGGTKIIRTVGYNIFRLRPIHSFGAQLSASLILLSCNLLGAPVSTTQIVSSSVMGVGNAYRRRAVRWQVIRTIFLSWLLTIPLAGLLAVLIYLTLSRWV